MNTSKELIASAKNVLEDKTSFAGLVGNRMHYPMLITMNGDATGEAYRIFSKAFKRMWPQTCNHILFVKNLPHEQFADLENGSAIDTLQLQNRLDQVRLTRDVFESMLKWCVYNIIDTSQISSLEEFKQQYNLIGRLNDIIAVKNTASMLIVLLDESTASLPFAGEIRQFLSTELIRDKNEKKYDGTLIISNRTVAGEMYYTNELLQVVSGVIILSNNDAVTHDDDDIYKERYNCLFDNSGLTVAYSLLKRPNDKIAIQILDYFLRTADQRYLIPASTMEIEDWRKCLGLERGGIQFIDKQLDNLQINIDPRLLQALPVKAIPHTGISVEQTPFSQYAPILFEESFIDLVHQYIYKTLKESQVIDSLLVQYKTFVKAQVTAKDCLRLNEEIIAQLLKEILPAVPSTALPIKGYFISSVKYCIKKEIVMPFVKDMLEKMNETANQTISDFYAFTESFQSQIPISGLEDLGTAYRIIAENYCSTPAGEAELKTLVSPENNAQDFVTVLNSMFLNTIQAYKESFELSFLDEWQLRLDMKGDEIFKEIQSTFNNDFERKRFLYGNFPIMKELDCYMFHLFDKQKNHPTVLFDYFKQAFNGINRTQFLNTGYNDTVEAYRFLDCSGTKLVL